MDRRNLLIIPFLLLAQVLVAWWLPAADDEYYYWCWSQELQLSYYDHPPMIAYMIRASCAVFGNSVLAIRLPTIISINLALAIIASLTSSRWALALGAISPLVFLGGIISTPDTPLILAWTLYVRWLVWLHRSERFSWHHWLVGGLILGFGLLGKYPMALAVPGAALSLIRKPWKHWLPGFILHGLIGCLAFLPVLIYNYQLDFKPLQFQFNHSFGGEKTIRFFPEHLAVVAAFQSPLVWVMLVLVLCRKRFWHGPERLALAAMFAFAACFFLVKSLTGKLQANWSAVQFIAFIPLLGMRFEELALRPGLKRLAVVVGFIPGLVTLGLLLVILWSPNWMPSGWNRVKYFRECDRLARVFAEKAQAIPPGKVILCENYRATARYRYFGVNSDVIFIRQHPSHFQLHPRWDRTGDEYYAIVDLIHHPGRELETPDYREELGGYFRIAESFGCEEIIVSGELKHRYYLNRYVRIKTE